MTLGDLIKGIATFMPLTGQEAISSVAAARKVAGVEHDSRRVVPGALFVATRGQRHDATAFGGQAVARGASAVIAESPAPEGIQVPWLQARDGRLALAAAAAVFWERPSDALVTVGVTGTNGKTTTTYILADIFEAAGLTCGRIGTVSYRIGDEERDASRTTPEAPDVQRLLREMVARGCAACVMEVSSHALVLRRVDFMRFTAAVFTNLTRDHLDFHQSMENYFLAKRRLFEMLPERAPAVVNVDDPYGARLAREMPRALTYSLDSPSEVRPTSFTLGSDGFQATLLTPRGSIDIRSPLLGRPNAYNLLAAIATAIALDVPTEAIATASAALRQVPGRLERVSGDDDDVFVLVDYAHTDDALKNLLETVRPLSRGRLYTVFGCGGDRDRTKRPLMGAVAGRLSDVVVLTSDNPRSEEPEAIIDEIKTGLVPPDRPQPRNQPAPLRPRPTPWVAIVDRRAAITHAIIEAEPGDLVVIAGKGHEKYQEIAGRSFPFDDANVARAALAARRGSSPAAREAVQ